MTETRDFLSLADHEPSFLLHLLNRAHRLKAGEESDPVLAGKVLAMIFRKSSTRTRVAFEVAMLQLGGHALFLSEQDSQIGRGESMRDTAGVLSRYVDGIVMRTFAQEELEELARSADVPVVNGLTDLLHPCQVMADLLTVQEAFGPELGDRSVAWIGDGNNMAHSWLNAAGQLGFELRLACPEGHEPEPAILNRARERTSVLLTRDPAEAAAGAHVVTTDVWASMGQEAQASARAETFAPYRVDRALLSRARPDAIFLHCLPAHRGEEVTAEVLEGPRSRVFEEAENRLHIQKAILAELL